MDAGNPMTPQNHQKREDRRRKRKAILAGGVVLGLGAAVTLAAWSDDVFADGVFNTGGVFRLEGSPETTSLPATSGWVVAENSAGAIPLLFSTADAVNPLTPGDTAYAPLAIRLTVASTLDGVLNKVTATATGPMAGALTYSVTSGATTCASGGEDNGTAWVSDKGVNSGASTGADLDLESNAGGTAGDVVQLCVAVTFPNTDSAKNAVVAPGTDPTTVTWDFYGVQDS
ncbi:SipW-dependent-type signal peptide-containing protein [Dietzia sp. CH92]|uniref:SipW-dependent-type signal peptide-containing protein n=1 Tax=Dietzia sp. CH92 TaxID=3051823 RepID=UPI0028D6D2D9|nr:SipW-dependent-type signal peptide-containing protein [Dietzia sp. CH92]